MTSPRKPSRVVYKPRPIYNSRHGKTFGIMKDTGGDRRRLRRSDLPPEWRTPVYVEGGRYSKYELEYMADEILRASFTHPKAHQEHPMVLLEEHLKSRKRREIYVGTGIPDPSIVSGLYWRTHPEGRKFNVERLNGEGFYR